LLLTVNSLADDGGNNENFRATKNLIFPYFKVMGFLRG
jgi:hypothetical protein